MKRKDRRLLEAAVAVLLIMGATFLVLEFGADGIVNFIGVENTYFIAFLVALFGGMTSFGAPTYITTIVAFVSGGALPWLIALAAGTGTFIGDTLYYFVSQRGRHIIPDGRFKRLVVRAERWIVKRGNVALFFFTYGYIGLTPLPNDVITITLGVANAPKRAVIPAIALGAITHAFILAYIGKTLFGM